MIYNTIPGYCNFEDVYRKAVEIAPSNSLFVEIGCYLGKSTILLGELVKESHKNIKIIAIDIFGDYSLLNEYELKLYKKFISDQTPERGSDLFDKENPINIYNVFINNLKRAQIGNIVEIIKLPSHQAHKRLNDSSCFFIYIDGEHDYNIVKKDIELYLPKVAKGGIIAGHDYKHPELTSVKQAVDEIFGENNITKMHWSWWKQL